MQDTVDEVNETVTVAINTATNATPSGGAQTITITDDDADPTANSQSVTTDQGIAVAITLTGTEGSTPPLPLTYTVTTGPTHGTLSGTAPNLTYTPAAGYSGPDSFQFTVNNGANTSAPAAVSITVTPAPTVTINDPTVTEGDSGTVTATFTVSLSNANGQTVSLNYATANNTAVAGSDYTASSGTVTFTPGQTSRTISVTVFGDTLFEGNESFFVNLTGLSYGTFADPQGLGTITDDDAAASIAVVSGNNQSTVVSTAFAAPLVAVVKNAAGNPVQGVTVTFTPPGAGASAAFGTPAPVSNASGQVSTGTATANGTAGGPYTVTATATGGTAPSTTFSLTNLPATSFSINDVSVTEGNSGTTLVTFTVTASPANNVSTSTVNWATADGTATTADGDYVPSSGNLTFAPGVTTQTFTVTVNSDVKFEGNETFLVNLSGATNAGISDSQGVGTITNDDPSPTLSVNDVTLAEGNAGTMSFTFTVSLSAASGQTTTVNYATADGTATAGSDYAAASGTLTFAPGVTTRTVTVLVTGDTTFENTEAFALNLSAPTNAVIADGQGVGTVTNDDAAPTLAINDVTASEAAGTLTFTVTRTGATEVPISVGYATADGTAVSTPGGPGTPDFTATSGTLAFAPSLAATATQTFTVSVTNDAVYEAAEQFAANLSGATGVTIADAQGVATVTNDDPAPTLSIGDVTVAENGTATFTVTLTGATALPVAVNYATADGTAVSTAGGPGTPDYTATSGTLTFNPSAAGTQTLTVAVPLVNDATNEPAEQFAVNLSGPTNGATIADAQGIGTITDNDAVPTLSISSPSAAEGNAGTTALTFTVTLSAASAQVVTVAYTTANGTATAGPTGDYLATAGVLTFAPGVTTQSVTVLVNGDTTFEADETVLVTLAAPVNATVGTATGTGTITNDDPAPTVTLSVAGSPLAEAGGVATVTATLSNPSSLPVTVNLGFGGTAAAADYTASAASILIPAGSLTGAVTLTGVDDAADENPETVTVAVTTTTNATAATPQQVTATIADDDLPAAVAESYTTAEDRALTVAAPGLLGNDNAAPGSTAELVGAGPAHGTLTPLATGGFTYTPAADFTGADSFQYRVRNAANEVSTPVTVSLTVTPVNDAPSFTKGPDQTLPRGAGAQAVPGWATAVSRGPADEGGQGLTFLVTTDTPALFAVQPAIDPATGTLTYTPADFVYGTATVTVRLMDDGGTAGGEVDTSAPQTFTITVNKHKTNSRPVDQNEFPVFAVGGGAGGPGTVTVYAGDGSVAYTVAPFADGTGARGVVADATGDGVADVVAGTGPGVPGKVVVIDGTTRQVVRTFTPFGPSFTGGVFVAAGDVDGDGAADIAVSADTSGGPRVVVYSGATGAVLADFFGIEEPAFRGGTRVAFGDVNADGLADLVVSAGTGGGPRVAVYDGASVRAGQAPRHLVGDFFAFDAGLRDGAFLTAGDVNGDGFDDLIFGGGPGGGPRVTALDSKALFGPGGGQFVVLTNFFTGDAGLRDGARVAAKDFDGDRKADLVTAVPTPAGSAVGVILGKNLGSAGGDETTDLDLAPGLLSGVFVG